MIILMLRPVPPSVQIEAIQIGAVVTRTDSIRIDHRNDQDLIMPAHIFAFFVFAEEVIYKPFANKRGGSLSWMLSGHYKDDGSVFYPQIILLYRDDINPVPSNRIAHRLSLEKFLLILDLHQIL